MSSPRLLFQSRWPFVVLDDCLPRVRLDQLKDFPPVAVDNNDLLVLDDMILELDDPSGAKLLVLFCSSAGSL